MNRKLITELLFALYEREPFSIDTQVETVESCVWGGYYDMDVTTASIKFNDNNSFTTYQNYLTNMLVEWKKILDEKDHISKEAYEARFEAWKKELFVKAEELDTMEKIRNDLRGRGQ